MSTSKDAFLAQYEKSQATSGTRVSQEDRMKKYFTTLLDKGKKSGEKRVRILPTKDGSSPFVEVKFHEIQVDGQWMKLYDPAQEKKRSPLNEVRDELLMTGLDSDKELAKNYRSRTFYIVKLIDRDHEEDGPKFWRFKFNVKKEGILDKIAPIYRNSKDDISDPEKGRDLILSLSLSKSGNGKEYTTVSSVIPADPSLLSEDADLSKTWVENPLTWSDVYSRKSEDYLDMVAKGEVPKWDNANGKWASSASGEVSLGGAAKEEDPQDAEEPDPELPF